MFMREFPVVKLVRSGRRNKAVKKWPENGLDFQLQVH
jgi:hypothetical protein